MTDRTRQAKDAAQALAAQMGLTDQDVATRLRRSIGAAYPEQDIATLSEQLGLTESLSSDEMYDLILSLDPDHHGAAEGKAGVWWIRMARRRAEG